MKGRPGLVGGGVIKGGCFECGEDNEWDGMVIMHALAAGHLTCKGCWAEIGLPVWLDGAKTTTGKRGGGGGGRGELRQRA